MTATPNSTPAAPEPDPQARTMRILAGIAVGGILLAVVLGVLIPGATGEAAALILGGLSGVLGVCLGFYAVGRSEDRERAQRPHDS